MTPEDVQNVRARLGWTMDEMGSYFGVSSMSISRWERGLVTPAPYHEAALRQLKERLDAFEAEQRRQQFVEGLKSAAVAGGVFLFLRYLFSEPDDGSDHDG